MIVLRTDNFISPEHRARILREVKEYGVAILDGADWSVTEVESDLLNVLRRRVRSLKKQRDYARQERDFTSKWFNEAVEELEKEREKNTRLNDKVNTYVTELFEARKKKSILQDRLTNFATGLTSKDLDLARKLKYGNVATHNLSFSYDTDYGTGVEMSFRFKEGSHDSENYLWKSLKERMV